MKRESKDQSARAGTYEADSKRICELSCVYAGLELEGNDTLSYRTESDSGLCVDVTRR